jgi:hypothetical protein
VTLTPLRGPCGHLQGELDAARGLIREKCRPCSRRFGRPVYHWYSAAIGAPVAAGVDDAPNRGALDIPRKPARMAPNVKGE